MSVLLTLPVELDEEETIPYDEVVIYRRESAFFFYEVGSVSLGTASYTDAIGRVDDEYHIRFREAATGVLSMPSGMVRIVEPYKQREEDGVVVVTFELDTVAPVPTVDFVAIYRRKPAESVATRIALVPIGTERWQDPDGEPGDVYHSTFVDTTNSTESQPSEYQVANAGTGLIVVSGRFEDLTGTRAESFEVDRNEDYRDIEVELRMRSDSTRYRTPTARGQILAIIRAEAKLDEQGRWSVVLVPNDLISPANTYYSFRYRGHRYFKRLQTANGAVQNFALLPDVDPDVEGQRFRGRNF